MRQDEEDSRTTEEGLTVNKAVSRREFLKYAGLAGAVVGLGGGLGGLVAACGGGTTTTTGGATTTSGGATTTTGASTTVTTGATTTLPSGKSEIVIGAARPLSGSLAFFEANAFGPCYKLWVDEVNTAGGIQVGSAKLPVRMLVYDDQSNLDTTTRLIEKLIKEDKVDFIFPPASTAYFFAAAGVTNDLGYLLMGAEGGATSIRPLTAKFPMFFGLLNFSDWNELPVLMDIFNEVGVKSIGMAYLDDLHGIEYSGVMKQLCLDNNIPILYDTSIPADMADFSTVIKQVQQANPDCFFVPCYPQQNYPMVGQMIGLNYNPKMLCMGPGTTFAALPYAMGADKGPEAGYKIVEGVTGYGAWSIHSSPALNDLHEKLLKRPNFTEANMDYWGHAFYVAGLEMFKQAIEKAGSLDNKKVAEVLKTEHFNTVLGDTWFDHQLTAVECHPGQDGQWQSGIFEVIDTGAKRTAKPIYPKPPWPTA
jgi:branched-chain amino acid transport system substrate-binding protein